MYLAMLPNVLKHIHIFPPLGNIGLSILCKIFRPEAWHSGHRIRLKIRRPGFEFHPGVSFLGKTLRCSCV
jgi:hypothetical protein